LKSNYRIDQFLPTRAARSCNCAKRYFDLL